VNLLLAVDVGTSSTRACLYHAATLEPIPGAAGHRPHEPTWTVDGGSELPPEQLLSEVVESCRDALDRAPVGSHVLGVGVATFWHSILGVDEEGAPTTPVLMWSDRRSASQVARLRREFPDAPERTGCPWHMSYVPGKLAWLAETFPQRRVATARFVSPGAWIIARLHGDSNPRESTSMASASGLWDHRLRAWDADLVRASNTAMDQLPDVDDTARTGLDAEFSDRLPELADVPWFAPIGDGAASNLGCGAGKPGRIALMIGTSGAIRARATGEGVPTLPAGLWRYQSGPGRYLLGGALSNGGSLWAWLAETLRLGVDADERLGELTPESHGLVVLPFLSGERAPLWRDDLSGTISGLRSDTTAVQIARASLEAVAYRFASVRDSLRSVVPSARLIGTGAGLLASPAWRRILVDVLEEPMDVSAEEEASARGAALTAWEGLGLGRVEDAPDPPVRESLEPDPSVRALYRAGRARHERLLASLDRP